MKKFIILVTMILLFTGCTSGVQEGYHQLTFTELEEKIENKESFVLFIGAESCTHCATYKETLKEIIQDYDVEIQYIDLDTITSEEQGKIKEIANFTGTPTTVFIKDGKEESAYNRITGDRDYDYIANKLENNGYKKRVK